MTNTADRVEGTARLSPQTQRLPRILFVSYTADWSGPTNSLLHLLRRLRERFECQVLMPGTGKFEDVLLQEEIAYHQLPSLRKGAIPAMVRLFRREGYNLIYTNNTSSASENALIAAKICSLPLVCHIRGIRRTDRFRRLTFLRFADATISVSRACGKANEQYTPTGASHVIHNGVEVEKWGANRAEARNRLLQVTGLPEHSIIVMAVGNVTRRKGYHLAVEIMRGVARRDPSVQLIIVGRRSLRPEYMEELQATLQDGEWGTRVHFLGFRHDVPILLQGADAYLHTALIDPHPRAVLEAMAARLPVVAFASDGVAESIIHGEMGYLVPTGDVEAATAALNTVVQDPELRRRFGEAAKAHVARHFSDRETARRVGNVIEGVLNRRGPSRGASPPV